MYTSMPRSWRLSEYTTSLNAAHNYAVDLSAAVPANVMTYSCAEAHYGLACGLQLNNTD